MATAPKTGGGLKMNRNINPRTGQAYANTMKDLREMQAGGEQLTPFQMQRLANAAGNRPTIQQELTRLSPGVYRNAQGQLTNAQGGGLPFSTPQPQQQFSPSQSFLSPEQQQMLMQKQAGQSDIPIPGAMTLDYVVGRDGQSLPWAQGARPNMGFAGQPGQQLPMPMQMPPAANAYRPGGFAYNINQTEPAMQTLPYRPVFPPMNTSFAQQRGNPGNINFGGMTPINYNK